jgi:hypothetical protein
LEVLAANHRKVKQLEQARKDASAAAQAAKEDILRQKAVQRVALEQTRRELEAARQAALGLGKGIKRPPAPTPEALLKLPVPKFLAPVEQLAPPAEAAPPAQAEDEGDDID